MSELLKFTFNTAFGTQPEGGHVQDTIPTFTQDDVDAARTQGFLQGRTEGINEAKAEGSSQHSAILSQIAQKLNQAITQQTQSAASRQQQAQHYALLISKKIAHAAIKQYPSIEVTDLVDECLSFISNIPHLVVTVNHEHCQIIQDELQPVICAKGYEGKLIILGQDDMNLGDCKIEWADGGVSKTTQEIIVEINNKINSYFEIDTDAVVIEDNLEAEQLLKAEQVISSDQGDDAQPAANSDDTQTLDPKNFAEENLEGTDDE